MKHALNEPTLKQQQPSLIPLPQSVLWTKEVFPLNKYKGIFINNNSLRSGADKWIKMIGKDIPIKNISKTVNEDHYSIRLKLGKVPTTFGVGFQPKR